MLLCTAVLAGCDLNSRNTGADGLSLRDEIDRAVAGVYPALVRISVVMEKPSGGRMRKFRGSGSGTIISKDGYVLTNYHVAGRATRIVCRMSNREEVEARLVGRDPMTDLALLKLDLSTRRSKTPLPVARFGDSDTVRVGDTVLAMGSPAGLSQSVTLGIVANAEMVLPGGRLQQAGENVGALVRWIGHDAVIFPGNSGGPLVNLAGEIIGVNEIGVGSLGGAIPGNLAKSVAEQLIKNDTVKRVWTGLQCQPLLKNMPDVKGVLVAGVAKESPAAKAGVQPGDVITHFDGVAVHSRTREEMPLFNRVVLSTPVGKKVAIDVLRDGKNKTFSLTTVVREPAQGKSRELRRWGITAANLTRASARAHRRPDKNGVLVGSIRSGGPASEAKPALKAGDVIVKVGDTPVTNLADLIAVTDKITRGKDQPQPTLVAFERRKYKALTVIRIGSPADEDKPERAKKAWLGVSTQVLTRELGKALGLKGKHGVRVTRVYPETTAAEADIQVGDILLKLDGQVISARQPEDTEVFDYLVRQYKIGAEVDLSIVRDGKPKTLTVRLEGRPKPPSELKRYKHEDFEFAARDLAFADKVNREPSERKNKGVRIASVQSAGWAALAGLATGDILLKVDGQEVADIAGLKKIMKKIRETKPRQVVFFVRRGIHTRFVELEPDWKAAIGAK